MKKVHLLMLGMLLALTLAMPKLYAEPPAAMTEALTKAIEASSAKDNVKAYAKDKLLALCVNSTFVAEVKAQNDKAVSLDEIKKIDEEWAAAEEELPIQKEIMTNACAQEVNKIVGESSGVLGEVFVMDNQGANVGQNELTSDYWQGDEPKWQNAYNGGKGGVDIAEERLDKSSGTVDQKISLPIIDADGTVVGAICFGVQVQKL